MCAKTKEEKFEAMFENIMIKRVFSFRVEKLISLLKIIK